MMRLKIDGYWEPRDFIETFEAIESLYCITLTNRERYLLDVDHYRFYGGDDMRLLPYDAYLDATNRWMLDRARRTMPDRARLYVERIEFASPGGIDFAGVGKATEALDRLVGRLISFFTERRLRREKDVQAGIESEILRQNLLALKIDNARRILDLRRDFPGEEHLIALAVRDQDKIADRIAQGQITGTSTSDSED